MVIFSQSYHCHDGSRILEAILEQVLLSLSHTPTLCIWDKELHFQCLFWGKSSTDSEVLFFFLQRINREQISKWWEEVDLKEKMHQTSLVLDITLHCFDYAFVSVVTCRFYLCISLGAVHYRIYYLAASASREREGFHFVHSLLTTSKLYLPARLLPPHPVTPHCPPSPFTSRALTRPERNNSKTARTDAALQSIYHLLCFHIASFSVPK